jgi:cell division protein FtsN
MTDNEMESGFELELDNRKLIIAFAVLILVIGCFFVWGYMIGKRQGQLAAITGSDSAAGPVADETLSPKANTDNSIAEDSPQDAGEVQQDLDWYQSVNKKGEKPVEDQPVRKSASKSSAVSGTYSVQVGAFRRRQEADDRVRDLQAKGFDCRVVSPEPSGEFYRVKVGRFSTRAEAVAMVQRLKNSGFDCFVKQD